MTSNAEVKADLTELALRLRMAVDALTRSSADRACSPEERLALCEEVKAITTELKRDWKIEAFADWRVHR